MPEDKPQLLQQLFGPLFSLMGPDLEEVYKFTREKLLAAYARKVGKPDDGEKINPRIAYEALTSAAFTGTDVAAEYFMGALAASRSPDGQDDSVIRFVATMKGMASSQLRLHYLIYRALNKILVKAGREVRLGIGGEIRQLTVFFYRTELMGDVHSDLIALHSQGLLNGYEHKGSVALHRRYVSATPTIYGIQLFAVAHNSLVLWDVFHKVDFGDFEGLPLPRFAPTLEELYALKGGPPPP